MKRLIAVLMLGLASLSPSMAQDPEIPKVTASEVVDRETLKAFVEGGKEYLEGIRTLTETAKLRAHLQSRGGLEIRLHVPRATGQKRCRSPARGRFRNRQRIPD